MFVITELQCYRVTYVGRPIGEVEVEGLRVVFGSRRQLGIGYNCKRNNHGFVLIQYHIRMLSSGKSPPICIFLTMQRAKVFGKVSAKVLLRAEYKRKRKRLFSA